MKIKLEILKGIGENNNPIIKLTKSKSGETGTATFFFFKPKFLNCFFFNDILIESFCISWQKKKIETKDIHIFFKEGKPILVKTIFVLKNSTEWFDFLNLMDLYSKEKGLFFESETF
jgi:photosystem II protein